MSSSILQGSLNKIYELFRKDTAKMLIITGALGWGLSSAAQMLAVLINPKIKKDQKGFLLPQEAADAGINIASFLGITFIAKKMFSKLASTGKVAPLDVRNYINSNETLAKQYGKVGFNLDKVIEQDALFPKKSYLAHKNFITTVGTVGASILATNVVTPILRNAFASKVQKKYIENRPQVYSSNMKV